MSTSDATQRTVPIAEVLRSEARLRALVESDSVMVWTTDARGMVEDMPVWRRLTGQTVEEVRGAGWANAIHPDDREATTRAWWSAHEARRPYRAEYRLRMADGSYRWFEARGVPVLDGRGQVREWAGTFHDVQARHEAEAEREALLERLQAARRAAEAHAAEAGEMASRLQEQAAEVQHQMAEAQAMAEELEQANAQLIEANQAVQAALEDEARLVETLHRIGLSLTSERDLARIVQAATDEATALTGAQFGAFFYNVLDEQGEWYTLYTLSGAPREAFERFPMPRNTEVFAPTFHGEGVVRSRDITRDPRYGRNEPYQGMPPGHLPVRSYLAVPVMAQGGGEVLGGLFFGHAQPDVFTERAERVAVGIAGWAAVAIQNARLHEAERRARAAAERAAERAERLLEVAEAMARALTPAAVAEVALEQGMRAVAADAGSMALLAADGAEFETVGTRGYPPEIAERFRRYPLHAGRPISDTVLSGEPVLLPDLEAWHARYPETVAVIRRTEYEGYAAVPIRVDGRAVGALGFSFRQAQRFDAGLGVFLETLAGQCAAALERARLYQAEHAARAEAEAANQAKGQFLASMSHELRTPLNAIGGYVDLIQMELRGPVTEQQQADLERIKRAQQHLLGLINDVLNFAKLEAGRIELRLEEVSLGELLDDVEALIAPQAATRGIAYAPAKGDLVTVRADREKLEQVLLNLLSNAVKFTAPGGRVWMEWAREAGEVRVRVHDTGCGIPANRLESIFEPFVQVDPDLTRTRMGTGLGLAISRELARAMDGDITVESRPGEGSTFTVHLQPA